MPAIPFATSAYTRRQGDLPELPVVNMYAEAAPVEGGVVLLSRLGLEVVETVGNGPIRGIFQGDGVLGGARFVVSGSTLYRGTTSLGTIDGTGPVSFAASETEILVSAGATLWRYNGTTLTAVDFPDDASVSKVLTLAGYFIAIRAGTQQFYWSNVLDGATWEPLSFASAEDNPDRLRDAVVFGDQLALFGSATTEFWVPQGVADAPFAPITGKVYDKGVRATGCAVPFDNGAAFIGSNGVYLTGNVPIRISEPGIEERLTESASASLWTFSQQGHEFLAVRLDAGTWLYDAQTQQWCEFASYGRTNWQAQCYCAGLFGDDSSGKLLRFGTGYVDDGKVLERRFRAGIAQPLPSLPIRLGTNPGRTGYPSGVYADPLVEMRSSRDGGAMWSDWRATALGAEGRFRTLVEWRRCGRFDYPGALFEFRVTDPVPFRVSSVIAGEPIAGRSR